MKKQETAFEVMQSASADIATGLSLKQVFARSAVLLVVVAIGLSMASG